MFRSQEPTRTACTRRFDKCKGLASRLYLNVEKHERKLESLAQVLRDDEELLSLTTGLAEGNFRENLVALTDNRIIVLKNNPKDAIVYDLDVIIRIDGKTGFSGGRVDLFLPDSKVSINNVHKNSTETFLAAALRALKARAGTAPPTSKQVLPEESTHPISTTDHSDSAIDVPESTSPSKLVPEDIAAPQGLFSPLIVPPRKDFRPSTASYLQPLTAKAVPERKLADPALDVAEGLERPQTIRSPHYIEMSDQEHAQVIDRIDKTYGSRVARHRKKVAAIPDILRPGELLHFFTDAHLAETFLLVHDLFVVTGSRVLVIRNDGKRVDTYELSGLRSLTAKEPITEGSISSTPTIFTFAEREVKALIYATAAAVPFMYVAHRVASHLRSQSGKHPPELNVPYEIDLAFASADCTAAAIDPLRVPAGPLMSFDRAGIEQRFATHTKRWNGRAAGAKLSRTKMVEMLLTEYGAICAGCLREFDDPSYLELDHIVPRSDGGPDHISNRLLLCGPCNRIKSNRLTLSGLRAENQKRGRMANRGVRER